ncbi:hypothetical protein AB0F88_44080 [Streptosporangium sp. NPDC023963]|uniref:hypothetical protein n=1 Tax=Streptosporangium sp. NPDC023963 TaxID=3155608 RepID=UPI00343F7986
MRTCRPTCVLLLQRQDVVTRAQSFLRWLETRWAAEAALIDLRERLSTCDRKLSQYRSALDAGGDPIEISSWINETKGERARLEGKLKAVPAAQRINVEEIRSMIGEVGDLVRLVGEADPDDKADLCTRLGLKFTYYPEKQYVEARIESEPPHVRAVCVRGGT